MYAGPGSAGLMAAAAAWNGLAAELNAAALGYDKTITALSSEEWLAPPPLVAGNRAETAQLIQTNVLGHNPGLGGLGGLLGCGAHTATMGGATSLGGKLSVPVSWAGAPAPPVHTPAQPVGTVHAAPEAAATGPGNLPAACPRPARAPAPHPATDSVPPSWPAHRLPDSPSRPIRSRRRASCEAGRARSPPRHRRPLLAASLAPRPARRSHRADKPRAGSNGTSPPRSHPVAGAPANVILGAIFCRSVTGTAGGASPTCRPVNAQLL